MKRLLAILLLGISLILVGCSSISAGYITSKKYQPAYTSTYHYCTFYNKGVCMGWGTGTTYHPDRYWFDISQGDKNGWVYVTSTEFNTYKVGDYYGDK